MKVETLHLLRIQITATKHTQVVADLNRRLEACEGRLETRVAELAVKLDGVCQMERASHSPASQACLCSGQIEAVAAKVGTVQPCMLVHHHFFLYR